MVFFTRPAETNYSEKFLSCRRAPSPFPREKQSKTSRVKSKVKEVKSEVKAHLHRPHLHHFHHHHHNAVPTPGNEKKGSGFYNFPEAELGLGRASRHDSGMQDGRSWEDVLEKMHKDGLNIAGMPMSEKEKRECATKVARGEKCGCLGPLGR